MNDSIVLISFFKDVYKTSDNPTGIYSDITQALAAAVKARFRAVLLTSLTTIAGLMALMFETSSLELYVAPIAVTLCFGLAFATTLVLLVIPAMIVLLEAAKDRLSSLASKKNRNTNTLPSSADEVLQGNST